MTTKRKRHTAFAAEETIVSITHLVASKLYDADTERRSRNF